MAAPAGSAADRVMCSFPFEAEKFDGRRPLTVTFDTDSASDKSSVNVFSDASVAAVIVAVPVSRLIATLYSRSSS